MQTNSAIITQPKAAGSAIGTQLGEHGLETLIGSARPQHATPDLAEAILRSSQVFSAQLPASIDEAGNVENAIAYLKTPAPRKWVSGRVLTLLSQYFAPNMDEGVTAAIADDWCAMLAGYPAWAIANACRWWMSRENAERKRRPLPGDIQERAFVELAQVRAAEITLRRKAALPKPQEPERAPITDEERASRAKIAASLLGGFAGNHTVTGAA